MRKQTCIPYRWLNEKIRGGKLAVHENTLAMAAAIEMVTDHPERYTTLSNAVSILLLDLDAICHDLCCGVTWYVPVDQSPTRGRLTKHLASLEPLPKNSNDSLGFLVTREGERAVKRRLDLCQTALTLLQQEYDRVASNAVAGNPKPKSLFRWDRFSGPN